VLVTVPPDRVVALLVSAAASNVPAEPLGSTGGPALVIGDIPALPLPELHTAWTSTLPALLS
jgi:phosphoribosylformylglycinamidine synthase subunit PurL